MSGKAEANVTVCTPLPGMLKEIASALDPFGCALALLIAWRSEPGPLSFVLVTMKVSADAEATENRTTARESRRGNIWENIRQFLCVKLKGRERPDNRF